jgi:uncharacterized protein YndB with AHSA1/START domain
MVLRERTHVKATVERIWAILGVPDSMSRWNSHCVRCTAGGDEMRAGLRFQAAMRLGSGPERHVHGEVIACDPDRTLVLRFSGSAFPRPGAYVDEMYTWQPARGGTKIWHTVDFSHSGLPWLLKVLLKAMDLVGHKSGRSPLDGLKELAEEESA